MWQLCIETLLITYSNLLFSYLYILQLMISGYNLRFLFYYTVSVWRVYIINEGVGKTLKCRGFHNITINRDSTLSIINSCNQVPLATWDRDKIRRSGCLENLVFIEAGRRCQGGPGMLWMYCPQNAVDFGECLHRLASV